jgi:hypothetical protein
VFIHAADDSQLFGTWAIMRIANALISTRLNEYFLFSFFCHTNCASESVSMLFLVSQHRRVWGKLKGRRGVEPSGALAGLGSSDRNGYDASSSNAEYGGFVVKGHKYSLNFPIPYSQEAQTQGCFGGDRWSGGSRRRRSGHAWHGRWSSR